MTGATSAFGRPDSKRTATPFHKFVIELGIKGFFLTQGQTAHWSYVATHTGLDASTVRILGCDEVLYTGLAHRNRAAATASSFGVAANVELVLARRVQHALVRQCPLLATNGRPYALNRFPVSGVKGHVDSVKLYFDQIATVVAMVVAIF
jgi:hypothetical protein